LTFEIALLKHEYFVVSFKNCVNRVKIKKYI